MDGGPIQTYLEVVTRIKKYQKKLEVEVVYRNVQNLVGQSTREIIDMTCMCVFDNFKSSDGLGVHLIDMDKVK
jgi:hypothetical protein